MSPACAWLDAQHDSRRGPGFLKSITGKRGGRNPKGPAGGLGVGSRVEAHLFVGASLWENFTDDLWGSRSISCYPIVGQA